MGDGHLSSTIYSEAATGGNFIGVYGYASDIAQTVNYGGHFVAAGKNGHGVYGYASYIGADNYNFGGHFTAVGSNGRGVHAYGKAYDFYAAGPGEDYGSASSIRWKRNIVEIDNPLEKLAELRGVYFDWDEEHGGHHDVGMIAEEVGKVLPEIVVYEANGIDADGMDYSKLTPLLVEAVNELQQIVEAQQKRIEELENR